MNPSGLFILGIGGHARSIADVALDNGITNLTFIDASARRGEAWRGFQALKDLPAPLPEGWSVFPAIGDNGKRRRQIEDVLARGLPLATVISRRAYVGAGASVQAGSFVAHHAHLGPMSSIGRGTIINTAAIVEHDCVVGDFSHISVNSTLAGACRVGGLVFLGAGATVIDGTTIIDNVTVGAGSTVISNIQEPGTYVGSPARRLLT